MVNIWEYANMLPSVILTDKDGETYYGDIICVMDKEETEDTEDSLTLEEPSGRIRIFFQSQIEQIEVKNES